MIDYIGHKNVNDDMVIFYDGFLYIISLISGVIPDKDKWKLDVICLCPEYDDPISLKDIQEKYPDVHKVLHEDWREGYVYNYGNHRDENDNRIWERSGRTVGFA